MNNLIVCILLVLATNCRNFRSTQQVNYIDGQQFSGQVTYYDEWKFNLGSCGKPYENINPYLAALGFAWMKSDNPYAHPLCQNLYCLMVSGAKGTIIVKVTDSCAGCAKEDVDISNEVYGQVADFSLGRTDCTWKFVSCSEYQLGPYQDQNLFNPNDMFADQSREYEIEASIKNNQIQSFQNIQQEYQINNLYQNMENNLDQQQLLEFQQNSSQSTELSENQIQFQDQNY